MPPSRIGIVHRRTDLEYPKSLFDAQGAFSSEGWLFTVLIIDRRRAQRGAQNKDDQSGEHDNGRPSSTFTILSIRSKLAGEKPPIAQAERDSQQRTGESTMPNRPIMPQARREERKKYRNTVSSRTNRSLNAGTKNEVAGVKNKTKHTLPRAETGP